MVFLTGKTLLLTGGGRAVLSNGKAGSIGYGIATAYAKEGANIVITGRNVQKLQDAKEELERLYNIKVLPVQADISSDTNNAVMASSVAEQAIKEFGHIDVLINNAQASASGVTLENHTTAQLENFQKAYPDAFEQNVHTPPMGYFGDPEENIGRVCVQLAHPDFKYMTGETLTLEGGLGMRP